MEPTGLFLVLAWLQILPWLASSERPESSPEGSGPRKTLHPILRLHPPGPRYQVGDTVTLTCTAPLLAGRLGFWFFHVTDPVHVRASPETSRSYQIPSLRLEHTGAYTCRYWVEQGGQESLSPESLPISIEVTDPPAAPTLSLGSPNPVYYQGEQIQLSCSAPAGEEVTGYRFYRERRDRLPKELPSPSGAARLELRAVVGAEGPYTCHYWRSVSGKEVLSRESNKAYVTVLGERVTLNCSAPGGERLQGYRFYWGQEGPILEELPAPDGGARLEIVAEMGNAGPYTCVYWTLQSGRQIPSERSQPVSLSVQGSFPCTDPAASLPAHPAAPTLSLHPPEPFYLPGEHVTLRCSAPAGEMLQGYRFYRGQEGRILEELPAPDGGAQQEIVAEMGNAGPYTCVYWTLQSGREIPSERSRPVSLSVRAHPAAPTLSLHPPEPFYLPGERVTLRCSAPEGERLQGYRFYQGQEGSIVKELPAPDGGARPEIVAEMGNAEPYTCAYWTLQSGREILSMGSRPKSLSGSPSSTDPVVSLPAPPPAPTLSLDPPHAVYLPGEWVHLSCSAPGAENLTGYGFNTARPEQGAEELLPSRGGPRLEIQAAMGDEGPYACRYWSRVSGREIPSGRSRPIAVPVTEPPPAPRLMLAPWHPMYVLGERVTLQCQAPRGQEAAGYRFQGQRGQLELDRVPEPTGGARLELRVAVGPAGPYVCTYWTLRSGREVSSEQSRPVSMPVTDRPGSPSVSVSPDYPAYVSGERVEILCSAPPGASPAQYEFYGTGEPLGPRPGNASSWQTDLPTSGSGNVTLSYSCVYTQLIQGRPIPSDASDAISLAVFPAPAPPALRLSPPQPLYVTGETVTVECLIPPGPHLAQAHTLLKDGHPLLEKSGPPVALNVSPSDSGNYSCGYSVALRGRRLPSPPSRPMPLGVIDPPPQPELSVDPPTGAVSEGLPLNITCKAPGDAAERRFHFYRNGTEMVPGAAGSEISTTEPGTSARDSSVLRFPRAGPDSAGEFTCAYEENVAGRWIPSPSSQAVNVTVTAWALPIPLVAGCGGAAWALALLLLLVCLCRKKKSAGRRLSTSYWKSRDLRRSRIMRQSADISGVNIALQQKTQGGWLHGAPQDWGLLPKFPTEVPRPGRAAGGAAPPKCQKGDEDADSGAEFEFPDIDPMYTLLTFSSSTFRQGQGSSAAPEPVYSTPMAPPNPDPCCQGAPQ
ncbi:Fc receptor-like protein 5 [Emydura macquarii macquarii]|uniref:Fc receptor-like protein 5 n=1 Tax=Emydura macquarii macquarii TaxID=1129001 RepID=UPI00352A28B8